VTESSFATVARIVSEPSNAFDDLRIIASGPARLDASSRELIRLAADELETTQRAFIAVQAQLIETQRRLIAVNDQLIEARKAAMPAPRVDPRWNMDTGWIKCEVIA
jgi:hypothetical protein